MPEARIIGPLKPQSSACCGDTTPISTVRMRKMRLSFSSFSMSLRKG